MPGIGNQGQGVGHKAVAALNQDKGQIQGNADGKGPAEVGGGVVVMVIRHCRLIHQNENGSGRRRAVLLPWETGRGNVPPCCVLSWPGRQRPCRWVGRIGRNWFWAAGGESR